MAVVMRPHTSPAPHAEQKPSLVLVAQAASERIVLTHVPVEPSQQTEQVVGQRICRTPASSAMAASVGHSIPSHR